jgi:hypothetical protein
MKQKSFWRLIAKSLGEKSGKDNQEADKIAFIRFVMFLSILITNCFIVANTLRHWNNVPSDIPKTEEKRILNSSSNVLEV